jgi:hypothetical protein
MKTNAIKNKLRIHKLMLLSSILIFSNPVFAEPTKEGIMKQDKASADPNYKIGKMFQFDFKNGQTAAVCLYESDAYDLQTSTHNWVQLDLHKKDASGTKYINNGLGGMSYSTLPEVLEIVTGTKAVWIKNKPERFDANVTAVSVVCKKD